MPKYPQFGHNLVRNMDHKDLRNCCQSRAYGILPRHNAGSVLCGACLIIQTDHKICQN